MTAALVLCCSFQVATGWIIGAGHWYMQHVLPILTAAAWALFRWLGPRRARPVVVAALGLVVAHGAAQYATYDVRQAPDFYELNMVSLVPKGSVVLTLRPVEAKLCGPHIKSFLTYAPFSPVPTEELLERYLLAMRLFGRPPETVAALFEGPSHPDVATLISSYEFIRYPPLGRAEEITHHLPSEWKQRWMDFHFALPEDPAALVAHIRKSRRLDYILTDEKLPWPVVSLGKEITLYRIE